MSEEKQGCLVVAGIGIFLMVLPIGCFAGKGVQVGDGFRDSTVRRVVNTGVVFKTWEVEGLGDGFKFNDGKASPETFHYTVDDPAIISQLQTIPSEQKVRIHYRSFLSKWTPNGESSYRITKVETLK